MDKNFLYKHYINLLPKMEPGKQQGKPVKVRYSMPIVFKIE